MTPDTPCTLGRIFYCHGFASCFDLKKDKVCTLAGIAPVDGLTVDYTCPPAEVFTAFASAISASRSTLIVGTSMGGFFAAWLGSELGLPFIAINPAIEPNGSLRKYIGFGTTHFGAPFVLNIDVVDAYGDLPFRLDGAGIVALDLGDEVIDARATVSAVGGSLPLLTFEGGSHRFEHMPELSPTVREMLLGRVPSAGLNC